MKIIVDKIIKTLIMAKIFAEEFFFNYQIVKMSAYYDRHGKIIKKNWGDDINDWFLKEISVYKIASYDWSWRTQWFHRPYVASIGSILTLFDMDNAIVWGAGMLSSKDKVIGKPKEVRAVRGPLTRKRLLEQGIDCPKVYGDPALLMSKYYTPNVKKTYTLGVIAHYTDQNNPLLSTLKNDKDVLMIDIVHYDHWLDFIDQINQCEAIASSSLHGLIMSCAYNIPNVWIKLKGSELAEDFKYHDFFQSLGTDREAYIISEMIGKDSLVSSCVEIGIGSLNLEPLLAVCPFKLKDNIKFSR